MRYYIENENNENCIVCGYVVEREYIQGNISSDGLPIYALEDIDKLDSNYVFILGLGYTKMNTVRERIFAFIIGKGFEVIGYTHPTAVISPSVKIGMGNIFFEHVVVQPNCIIGDANIFQAQSSLMHDCIVGNNNFIAAHSVINGRVSIGNNCFLGSGSVIKNRIKINSFSLIGAAAYVSRDTDRNSVTVPQRSIVLDKTSLDML